MNRAVLAALALAFLAAHLPYLPSTLEDIDSVNFALAIRDYDVAEHRPHPPGYPAYVALAKIAAALVRPFEGTAAPSTSEARALAILALVGATLSIVGLHRVMACWSKLTGAEAVLIGVPWDRFEARAVAATALTVACPLFWYLAVRPMSDVPGLAAALAAQAALLLAWWRQQPNAEGARRLPPDRMVASGRMIVLGSLAAGLAVGFRSQNAVLTVPLLVGVLVDRIGRGAAGALIGSTVALLIGMLVWAVPLVAVSGGMNAYLAALGSQAGEDFAGAQMLYLDPAPRLAALALIRTFIFPWDSVILGSVVIALAGIGIVALQWRDRRSLVAVALLAFPYLVFHLLFQDTTFVRYALPLVPPVAFMAVCGLETLLRQAAWPATGLLAVWAVATASPVLAAYGSELSPTRRALLAMEEARRAAPPGALAMHQTFRRPLQAERVPITRQLPSPPRREWLELVRYWREGQTAPLWFLADPRRTDLALLDPRSRADRSDFSWRFQSLSDLGGMRPAAVTWHRLSAPGWFAEDGWALTPETAGIARVMGRGPSLGPITAWVRRRSEAVHMLIGGRHLGSPHDAPARFVVEIDGTTGPEWRVSPGFFVHAFDLPAGALAGDGRLARLTITSTALDGGTVPTAIEQFDLQSKGSMMWAYDEGWHESEYDPRLGLWRWTSGRSTLRIVDATAPVTLTMRVEQPRRYFDTSPTVRLTAAGRVLGETTFADTELWSVRVPLEVLQASGGRVSIETSRTFVPAEREGRADQRHLGLRVFGVAVTVEP